jgi:hypothetical protein
VIPALSSIIFRIFPVVLFPKKPKGIHIVFSIVNFRIFDSALNAAKCENEREEKYKRTHKIAAPAASQAYDTMLIFEKL